MNPTTSAARAVYDVKAQSELDFRDRLDDYARGQVDAFASVIEWLVDRYPAGGEPAVVPLMVDEFGARIQRYCELAGCAQGGA